MLIDYKMSIKFFSSLQNQNKQVHSPAVYVFREKYTNFDMFSVNIRTVQ